MKPPKSLHDLARRDPRLRFRLNQKLGIAVHLRGNLFEAKGRSAAAAINTIRAFLNRHPDLFGRGIGRNLKPVLRVPDGRGGTDVTLQQFHGAIRVQGGSVRVHISKDGIADTVRNSLFPDLARVPKRPRIQSKAAVRAAVRATKARDPKNVRAELLVIRHEGRPYLIWEVRLDDSRRGRTGAPSQWVVHVDATRSRVLFFYDNVQTAGPTVGNGTGYYSGAAALQSWFNDADYELRDTTRNAGGGPEIIVRDGQGTVLLSPLSTDADNNWNDTTSSPRSQHQGPEADAQAHAAAVLDYFQLVHGRNSFDGAGGDLTVRVHFDFEYNNGYWNGIEVRLGDGSGVAPGDDYECTDDWLAHEITHAYTQYTCGLVYTNESGALNESFSDVFSAFIFTADPVGQWLIFEDSWLKASAPASRNMQDPTNGGSWDVTNPLASVLAGHQPGHYSQRYIGALDNGGVHINSGIINHLFYLLTLGGTHALSGVVVTGIGQPAAEQLLWRCMTVNLVGQPNATFLEFREAMLDASLDLFPTDLAMLTQVKNAFNAVGIGPDLYVRDNVADTGLEPYPGTYLWASPDIINRTAPSASPSTDFADATDDSLWENVEFGQDNHIYVRVHNRGPESGDATINVYFSSASTFATPASWIHIGTLLESAIPSGAMRISGPLLFPSALIPALGHYCMIAVVSDPLDPAPDHTLIASITDYLNYVRNTNNIAYRNMDVVDLIPAPPGQPGQWSLEFEAYNDVIPRPVPEEFELRIDLRRFVPGARVRLRAPLGVLDAAIPRGLKLAGRTKRESVFEVIPGDVLERQVRVLNLKELPGEPKLGFDRLRLAKPARLRLEAVLPDSARNPLRPLKYRPELVVRQLWKGQAVGAVGLRGVVPKKKKRGRK